MSLFKENGTYHNVTLPDTVGELLLWYKKNVKSTEPDIASLHRKTSSNGTDFEYMTCIYDTGSSLSDIVVFKTVIPIYTFQTMEDNVYVYDNFELESMKEIVFRFRKFGDKVM